MTMDRLLTIDEAALMLGMSVRALYENPHIPRVKMPGSGRRPMLRFRVSDLERVIDAHTINPLPRAKAS